MSVSPGMARITWIATAALLLLGGCKNSPTPANNSSNAANSSSANAASAPTGNSPDNGASSANSASPAQQPAEQSAAPPPIVLPAGKILRITVDQSVSSKTANDGDRFDASLDDPVFLQGREVIRRGARITGVVTSAKSAGRFKGHAELGLALEYITVNGQRYRLHTSSVAESTKGRGKRTAVGGGGGAAFGAILGAIAGGGKGAAIGAVAGGGAGTAGAAFTGKRDIEIPAETRLDFKLSEPLTINPAS